MSGDKPLHFISWNINGLKSKTEEVFQQVKDADIVFLQETHIGPGEKYAFEKFQAFTPFFTEYDSRSKGVAILMKNCKGFKLVNVEEDDEGSFLVVTCKLRDELYTLVSVYNHKNDEDLLPKLTLYLQEMATGVLVIGGDFNTVLNPYLDKTSPRKNEQHVTLRNHIEKFTTSLHLVDIWRRYSTADFRYTYMQNKNRSRLDYIFMPEVSAWRVQSCEILQKYVSDHYPVHLKLFSGSSDERDDQAFSLEMAIEQGNLDEVEVNAYQKPKIKEIINGYDIVMAIQSLIKSENTGPDNIPVHWYKTNRSSLVQDLKSKYNKMLDEKLEWIPESFNNSILAQSDSNHHFFNVDYLIFTTILARCLDKHLEKFKNKERNKGKERAEKKSRIVISHRGLQTKLRSSFLKTVIEGLEKPRLTSHILNKLLHKLLRDADEPAQGWKQLHLGCPLTPVLFLLCLQHVVNKQTQNLNIKEEILIYGESIIIILPQKDKRILSDHLKRMLSGFELDCNSSEDEDLTDESEE